MEDEIICYTLQNQEKILELSFIAITAKNKLLPILKNSALSAKSPRAIKIKDKPTKK